MGLLGNLEYGGASNRPQDGLGVLFRPLGDMIPIGPCIVPVSMSCSVRFSLDAPFLVLILLARKP